MNYTEVTFKIENGYPLTDILIAELSEIGFESFEEDENFLKAYIPSESYDNEKIESIHILHTAENKISFTKKEIKEQNWNEVWESNFQPVTIGNDVYVRAPFHKKAEGVKYEIVIEPKMSFGTAHHDTTSLMIEQMLDEKIEGKSVLDMGCGTGILSILAEILGASDIVAIDNDEWAYNNALENRRKNKCKKIDVRLGDAGALKDEMFDVILANINRNILLEDMKVYSKHLNDNGILLLSGFLIEDVEVLKDEAKKSGLVFSSMMMKDEWIALRFIKESIVSK
jgi:ribosomal protein L11 methyltransferase